MRKVFFSLIFVAFCFQPFLVSAQVEPIILDISTSFPKPGEDVFFNVDSYVLDLNTAVIKWTVNGVVVKEAVGGRSITVKAGPSGSTNTVDVEVLARDGRVVRDGIAFYPAEVVLLWESDGYIPPFYKGSSPYVMGSKVKLTAIPDFFLNGKRLDPKDLVYTWKSFYTDIPGASGYGKNTFITDEVGYTRRAKDITVEVSAPGGIPSGSASVVLGPKNPIIIFYEKSPLDGILFNKALESRVVLVGNEIGLFATPYFFSSSDLKSPELNFSWLVDGFTAKDYENSNEIVLVRKGERTGVTTLSLSVRNPGDFLQSAGGDISLVIDNDN